MKTTKIMMIISILALAMTALPCEAKKVSVDNGTTAVYQYGFLPVQPVYSFINLCWEIDDAQADPNVKYKNAQTFTVVLYGLVDYSFGMGDAYTQVEDVLFFREYNTTDECISIDPSTIQADVLNFIAATEGISADEIQSFSFGINAKVKGVLTEKTAPTPTQRINERLARLYNNNGLAFSQQVSDGIVTLESKFSDPVSVYKMGWSLAPLAD